MEMIVRNVAEMELAAARILELAARPKKIVLSGEIGAGKTTLTQAFCRKLGVTQAVNSPTFALVNEYTYPKADGSEGIVHHLDLYRLNSLEEALDIGIEDYLDDDNWCLIEWPDLIEPLLPSDVLRIKIGITEDSSRKILFLQNN